MPFSTLSSLSEGRHPTHPLPIRLRHTSFFLIREHGRHIATFKSALCSEISSSTEILAFRETKEVILPLVKGNQYSSPVMKAVSVWESCGEEILPGGGTRVARARVV